LVKFIPIFLRLLWIGIFSLFLSQPVHCLYIEKLLIFCMLILYPVTLPKVCIRSRGFLVESLGFLKYRIIPSVNRDNLTSSFPIWIPFLNFYWLVALAKNSSIILNKSRIVFCPWL
jgi:hypothetical protein